MGTVTAAAVHFGHVLGSMGALTCTVQAGAPFETGLMDYYGNVAVSENLGGCAARYAGTELELPESGRLANLVNGVGTFSQFSIIGKPHPPGFLAHLASYADVPLACRACHNAGARCA